MISGERTEKVPLREKKQPVPDRVEQAHEQASEAYQGYDLLSDCGAALEPHTELVEKDAAEQREEPHLGIE